MWDALVSGIIAGYGIAIPVGAIALLIVGTAMRCGFACGAAAGAGAATADLLYATVAATAGGAVTRYLEPWATPIRWASAAVLVALAVRGLLTVGREPAPGEPVAVRRGELALTYGRFVGLTVINPMTVVFFGTIVIGANVGRTPTLPQVALFAGGAFAASLSWQTLLAAIGAGAGRGLSPSARRVATVVGNLLIVAMAVRIVL